VKAKHSDLLTVVAKRLQMPQVQAEEAAGEGLPFGLKMRN
jgi:hypothetical protein